MLLDYVCYLSTCLFRLIGSFFRGERLTVMFLFMTTLHWWVFCVSNLSCLWLIVIKTFCRPNLSVILLLINKVGLPLRGLEILWITRYRLDWTRPGLVTIIHTCVSYFPQICGWIIFAWNSYTLVESQTMLVSCTGEPPRHSTVNSRRNLWDCTRCCRRGEFKSKPRCFFILLTLRMILGLQWWS